jgi:hypothetical protein
MYAISIRMGLWMLLGSIAFFLLMYTIGLGYRNELHAFSAVIQLVFLYLAIQAYYRLHPDNIGNYMQGVLQGMGASIIGVGGFALFMTTFLLMEPTLMDTIRENSHLGKYLNPFTASLAILSIGLVVGLVGSYILTRMFNDKVVPD